MFEMLSYIMVCYTDTALSCWGGEPSFVVGLCRVVNRRCLYRAKRNWCVKNVFEMLSYIKFCCGDTLNLLCSAVTTFTNFDSS